LHTDDASLQQTTLSTFYSLSLDAPELIAQHVKTLVDAFLPLALKSVRSLSMLLTIRKSLLF
jgi:hypothetical protein